MHIPKTKARLYWQKVRSSTVRKREKKDDRKKKREKRKFFDSSNYMLLLWKLDIAILDLLHIYLNPAFYHSVFLKFLFLSIANKLDCFTSSDYFSLDHAVKYLTLAEGRFTRKRVIFSCKIKYIAYQVFMFLILFDRIYGQY